MERSAGRRPEIPLTPPGDVYQLDRETVPLKNKKPDIFGIFNREENNPENKFDIFTGIVYIIILCI